MTGGWRGAPLTRLLALVSAYLLWSLVFVWLYGGHGVLCQSGLSRLVKPVLAAGAAGLLGLHALLLWRLFAWYRRTEEERILPRLAVLLAASAMPAAAWLFLPVLFLSTCT
ncbi:hypothetical protein [Parvularcula oceani]|uniref:hypothetical protein n=1 Tax=Parvularcula oceani TaxID=1247963 RepID=UPI0004E14FB5|nr:hypothetical protein [Parvularcula oceani]